MDEIFTKVKEQIESSKIQPKKTLKLKKKQKPSPENQKKEPELKKIGTFGTAKREVFAVKKDQPDYIASPVLEKKVPGGYISKLPRSSSESKPDPVQPINPNYNISKKKTSTAIISTKPFKPEPPVPKKQVPETEYKVTQEIEKIMKSVSTADSEFEQFFKAKEIWEENLQKDLEKNPNLNRIIFPPSNFLYQTHEKKKEEQKIGPSSYLVKFESVEKPPKLGKFSKTPRMAEPKPEENLPLFPNYDFVLKNPPNFVYKPESEKTEQNKLKEKEESEREALKSIMYKVRNFDLPESQKQRVTGGVISPFVEVPVRFNYERLGPGKYEPNYESVEVNVWGNVAYKEPYISEYVPRFVNPGPGMYYVVEDNEPVGGFIPESPRSLSPVADIRAPLDPNYDFSKKRVSSAIILPEGYEKPVETNELGPGKYTPSYKLTEKRTDIDVLPFVQTKEKEAEIDNRLPLFINESQVRPGIPSFLYKDPVEICPPHLPDTYFHLEEWKFYDRNEDLRFARVPEFQFAPADFKDFKELEEDRETLARINQKLRGEVPSVGTYDPDPVSERAPAYDFGKMISRDPSYLEDLEHDDKEGDVLILDPNKPYKILSLVNMEKSAGRETGQNDDEYKNELILNPNIEITKKRVPVLVNMNKDLGRLEKIEEEDEQLELEPNYLFGKKKIVSLVNMEKQVPREAESLPVDDFIIIPEEKIEKPVKSLVNMEKTTGREVFTFDEDVVLVDPFVLPEKSKKNIPGPRFDKMTGREEVKEPELEKEVITDKQAVIGVDDMYKAVEPSKKAPNFNRYIGRVEEITEDPSEVPFVFTGKKY